MTDQSELEKVREMSAFMAYCLHNRILCWQYDAGDHCNYCAVERFGAEALESEGADRATDREGNAVHPVFTVQEWQAFTGELEVLGCESCGAVIDEYVPGGAA